MIAKNVMHWLATKSRFLPAGLMTLFVGVLIILADVDYEFLLMRIAEKTPMGDKLGHLALYGLLALSLNSALRYREITCYRQAIQLGSLIVLGFSCVEECSQLWLVSRTFDLRDMFANVLGIALANWIGRKRKIALE